MALVLNKCVTLGRSHHLFRMYVKVLVAQSYLTLCHPVNCNLPGSSVHGILQARILDRVAISFSRGSPEPGLERGSPTRQTDSLPSEPPGKPLGMHNGNDKAYLVELV